MSFKVIITKIENLVTVKYTITLEYDYTFNDIYEAAYDLVQKTCKRGRQIVLISHDKIKQNLRFKFL